MAYRGEHTEKQSWRFSREFWLANLMELCERAAYYGFFIVLTLYLTDEVGFSDKETGVVAGIFYAGIYFLPPFAGAVSDKIGFKNGLVLAFGLLSLGYSLLGLFPTKAAVLFFLAIVMVGGAFIKPLITGTVAKTTSEANRARGYSLFYWVVNVGSFSGKTFVPFIRQGAGLTYVNFFSAAMAFVALLLALFVFERVNTAGETKTLKDVMRALGRVMRAPRLMALILIVSGFWIVQGQLYATMPKYVIRLLGEGARPEWLANVNPAVVVLSVVLVTQLMRKRQAVTSMLVGMLLMPLSAIAMSCGPLLSRFTGPSLGITEGVALHPLTLMMIVGIALQGLAECFISPRFYEYFSFQAPRGEEGVYLGMSHLHSFFSALVGFTMSGFLLDSYCPDPKTLPVGLSPAERAAYYEHAHHIWYYFAAIGAAAALSLFIFREVTTRRDRRGSGGKEGTGAR